MIPLKMEIEVPDQETKDKVERALYMQVTGEFNRRLMDACVWFGMGALTVAMVWAVVG